MTINQPITIKDWQDGIAASPHLGFGLLKNVEIWSFPGAARAGKKPTTMFHTAYASTFTAVAATDVCTSTATVPNTGTCVRLTTTGTLPAGLSLATNYFINKLSATTFELCTTVANANAGTQVDITDTGTGTHTVTTVNPGTIKHYAYDNRSFTKFCIDSNGVVWYDDGGIFLVLGGNTLTSASGNGLAVFRVSDGTATYLFAYRNASIDVVNVFGNTEKRSPTWSNAWKTMNTTAGSANSHHSIVGQDNIVYFTDDRYVGSIVENAGSVFDPASAGTYTFNASALDLPLGSLAYWLEQLGVNLLISVGNDNFIYPWDRTSDSYGLPIPIGERGNKMKNIGNVVYVLAGTRGNIYYTQGTYARLFVTLPIYLTNNASTYSENSVTWGGIESALGRLIVGVGAASGQSGVYMIDAEGIMTLDNYPSTGQAAVTALLTDSSGTYDMGYAGGADYFSTGRYTSQECVIQSQLYRVGDKTEKTKFSEVQVQLANGITGTIVVSYRTDLTSAFTTLASFVSSSGVTSYDQEIGLIDLENVQFQIAYGYGLDLMEVRLIV